MTKAAARPKTTSRAPAASRREFCDAGRDNTPKPQTTKAQYSIPDIAVAHWGEGMDSIRTIIRRLP